MNSSKAYIEKRLEEILKRDVGTCIVLDGEWGVGKTTFWKNFSNEKFKENSVYVSLFGKESIQEIKQEISLKFYYKKNKVVSKALEKYKTGIFSFFTKRFADNKIAEFSLIMLDSLYTNKYKDAIICFDDFERISNKINLKDVLGLISEYKEQQNCNIVMILNHSKMTDSAKETQKEDEENLKDKELKNDSQIRNDKTELEKNLSEYKEKIMDYEFYYDPTPEESFSIVSSELKEVYRDAASQYFVKHDINNIRVMRRAINALNDYHQFIENMLQNEGLIKKDVINHIIGVSVVNAIGLSSKLDGFLFRKDKSQTELSDMFVLLIGHEFGYEMSQNSRRLIKNIFSYVKRSIVDYEDLEQIIKDIVKKNNNKTIKEDIRSEYFNGIYDLQYKNSDFANNLFGYLEKNKERILEIIEIDSFLLYIEKLGEFDKKHKEKYRKFAFEVLLEYLKYIFDSEKYEDPDIWIIIDKMIEFDQKFKDLYDEFMYKKEFFKISTAEGIIENILMSKSKIPEVLSSKIKSEDLEKYCYANKDFVYSAVKFLRFGRHTEADELKDKILEVFKKISKNGNESQRRKMELILEYLNNNKDC